MIKNLFFGILLVLFISSCASNKDLVYFKDVNRSAVTVESAEIYKPVTIQPLDVLSINISSANAEASAVYNRGVVSNNPTTTVSGATDQVGAPNGYLVDQNGNIQLPILGNVKAAGLSVSEFKQALTAMLGKYLKEPYVTTNIINFKITVLGDVGRPGILRVQNERISFTDAISLAGDLTQTAIRNNILIIREQNGKRQFIPVDLTSKNIFDSPYFYLKNNDIIYVSPGKYKSTLAVDNFNRNFGIVSSIVSIAITITYILIRK
ncbi:polysaccharide biosynthesis/export family protein [uncultured Mucilaginibacter sp.]|uniref:polysaccharide biosynthesis/export family protein n=1 Tax=uncultured Mucilaginibacter sp. TaxID=797541 RepID=UPI002611B2BA|nr:polysaccharide biosynthesis/export family protein [uncultured Mucilaginibacter sp.]